MRAAAIALLAFFYLSIVPLLVPAQAQSGAAATLAADIDEFFSRGATGFIVWQYGGDYNGRQIAVDQFTFYRDRDTEICAVMKEKASANPGKFIGVNINNIGAIEFTGGVATDHFTWLKANCGVSVVRVFAKIEGAAGVQNALTAGEQAGVQILVAIGDYSNGGGGMPQGADQSWYETGYKGEYQALVQQLAALKGHSALYGFELANEPHCGGNAAAIEAYKNWGIAISALLGHPKVGYGQMASQNTTRCDSPGPGDFSITNAVPGITMTSAHYYSTQEKANALLALTQSLQIGKPFYIGEAPPGDIGAEGSTYNADDAWYYLHPIRGVSPGGNVPERSTDIIREDLANQGYQTYCAASDATIKLEVNTVDIMERFISLYGGVDLETTSTYDQSTMNSRTPLYRDVGGKRFYNSSIEEYFGYIDSINESPSRSEIQTAPVNSLLSAEQRCIQSVSALTAAELMCERLKDWEKCALFSRPVPTTDWNVKQLLEKIGAVMEHRAGGISAGCRKLFGGTGSTESYTELQKAILNTPYYLDRSYRLGFLVTTIEYKRYNPPDLFNFFSAKHRGNDAAQEDPRHEVLITAFKIPDILTNKGGGETSGHTYWDDPAMITRNTLVPKKTGFDVFKQGAETLRNETKAMAKAASNQTSSSTIYCIKNGVGSPACQDELGKAIVDLINGRSPSCDANTDEPVSEISDSGQIPFGIVPVTDSGLLFRPGYGFGEELFVELFKNYDDLTSQNPHLAKTDPVLSLFKIAGGWQLGPTAQAKFYLVYPMGYELEEVTNVLQGTFFTAEQISTLTSKDPPADRFELKNVSSGLSGGTASKSFPDTTDPGSCQPVINPTTGLPFRDPETGQIVTKCPEKEFSLSILQTGGGGSALTGARLGYWLRKLQLTLNPIFTKSYAYIQSCRTTEQFLLGTCAGGPVLTPSYGNGSASDPNCGIGFPTGDEINPPYEAQSPLVAGITQVPKTPYFGRAMYYGKGLMNQVLENRRAQFPESMVKDCENGTDPKYIGCVALLRAGDMGREIWMQRPGQEPEGPFLVIDVASKKDISCLLSREWIVDIDWRTAERWGMTGVGPLDDVTLYGSKP